MQALLETIDLAKTYRVGKVAVDALCEVSMRVGVGEMVAVMGPSGCGKSSLMHILGAMTQPTRGKVLINGRNVAEMNERRRTEFRRLEVGFVFQKFNLLPTLTARANIEIARRIHGSHGDPEVDRRQREVLELLEIENMMGRRPAELSGGEQQRVAIARAVIKHPSIILADEPTGNLDTRNSEIVLRMFQELNNHLGQTIILVTHNSELTAYTERVIQMRDGRILSGGMPDEELGHDVKSETVAGEC